MPLFETDQEFQSYLSLLKKPDEEHEVSQVFSFFFFSVRKELVFCFQVVFNELTQHYNLNLDHLQACVVSEIAFTSPTHLVSILMLLREQAYLNALFQSCIRPKKQKGLKMSVMSDF